MLVPSNRKDRIVETPSPTLPTFYLTENLKNGVSDP